MVIILDQIQSALQWIITEFFAKLPTPLKLLLFLLFILLFGLVITIFLHMIGIHCTSSNEPVKMDMTDFTGNVNIIFTKKDIITGDNVSFCDLHPEKCGEFIGDSSNRFFWDCLYFARFVDPYWQVCNMTDPYPDCRYYYREGRCFNCTETEICLDPDGCLPILDRDVKNVCYGDVRSYNEPLSLSCRWAGVGGCTIPYGYVFNWTNGFLFCENDDICGVNSTGAYTVVDTQLMQGGAELLYEDKDEKAYTRMVGISCNNNLDPQISFFSIPIFDYKIWVFLYVIGVMFLFLNKINVH